MSQFYADESREADPTALPDAETFRHDGTADGMPGYEGEFFAAGWYWRPRFYGDPIGPFASEDEAIEDARI